MARASRSRPGRTDPLETVEPQSVKNLLAAALDAFAEEGYHGSTTRTISARAGLSPAALYVHFSSKSELLFELFVSALYGWFRPRGAMLLLTLLLSLFLLARFAPPMALAAQLPRVVFGFYLGVALCRIWRRAGSR